VSNDKGTAARENETQLPALFPSRAKNEIGSDGRQWDHKKKGDSDPENSIKGGKEKCQRQ
jgi:hypothetical protein